MDTDEKSNFGFAPDQHIFSHRLNTDETQIFNRSGHVGINICSQYEKSVFATCMLPKLESDDAQIPPEYREIYSHLCGEILRIKEKLREYRQLFSDSEQHVKLLNEAGPFLFHLIQQLFYDDLILSLSRLLDPAQSPDSITKVIVPNMTFSRLVEMLKSTNPTLAGNLAVRVNQMKKDAEPIQKYHRDRVHFSVPVHELVLEPS